MRKLASIRKISAIENIPNADKIVRATIGGWNVVTAIDNGFKVGDLVLYLEIDSWVPHDVAPFLTKEGQFPKVYNGVEGQRLKTIRLRGQVSQGLILPITGENTSKKVSQWMFEQLFPLTSSDWVTENGTFEGADLTDVLGVQKWEAPIPTELAGKSRGSFPSFICKTSQERCQNLVWEIFEKHKDTRYEVTLKLDGSSMTVFKNGEDLGVCSRNLNLDITQEGNSFVELAKSSGLLEAIEALGVDLAVQGELMGEGVQKNREGLVGHHLYVFDIFNIKEYKYLAPKDRMTMVEMLRGLGANIQEAPVLHFDVTLAELGIHNVQDLLALADGASINNPIREGLVFKSMDGQFSFKAISNQFLLGERD